MKVQAVHVGKKILLKTLQAKLKLEPALKEPLIFEHGGGQAVTLFKYGVVVFWKFTKTEKNKFLKTIKPFVREPFKNHLTEEVDVLPSKNADAIKDEKIHLKGMPTEKIALVSLVLSRSVALEHYEIEAEKALLQFDPVMKSLEEEGKTRFSSRELLKKVGFAMNARHLSMSQIALLDRPDLTWDDPVLGEFYDDLSDEYEIDDRYEILKEKLETIFRNVEFILQYIETKRSNFLELVIILLIVIEILIFVYEVWFM